MFSCHCLADRAKRSDIVLPAAPWADRSWVTYVHMSFGGSSIQYLYLYRYLIAF